MKQMKIKVGMLLVTVCSALVGLAADVDYADYPGSDFFKEGQEWTLKYMGSDDATEIATLKVVVGETTEMAADYLDYSDQWVNGSVSCKKVTVYNGENVVMNTGAYEIVNTIYLYAETSGRFEKVADFSLTENANVDLAGSAYTVDYVDFVFDGSQIRKRDKYVSADENAEIWVYGIGFDKFYLDEAVWGIGGLLQFESLKDADGTEYVATLFNENTFEPTNEFYTLGKQWTYFYSEGFDENRTEYTVKKIVTGDVEYCHMPCRTLTTEGDPSGTPVCDYNGMVFELGDWGRFVKTLDFNLEVGDFALEGIEMSEVTEIDEIYVNAFSRKRIKFKGLTEESKWKCWVEGIGANSNNYMYEFEQPTTRLEIRMEECSVNGECVFTYPDFFVSSGIADRFDTRPAHDGQRYDLFGRQIEAPVQGQLYIESGHLHLAR